MTRQDFQSLYHFIGNLQYSYEGQEKEALNRCNSQYYMAKAEQMVCYRILAFLEEKFSETFKEYIEKMEEDEEESYNPDLEELVTE